jgi:hypothetical protein
MMTMKTTTANKVWFGAALLFVAVAVAAAQVPGFFSICNAITGYQVNSAAPNGQVICGNGTVGTYSASCAINSATATALAATPTQCSGSTPVSTGIAANGNANCTNGGLVTTCNANGCYDLYPDGRIHAFGTVSMASTGTAYNTATITFPHAFTTQVNPTFNLIGIPSSSSDTTTPACQGASSLSFTTMNVYFARCIIAGAGGGNFDNPLKVSWTADGY